MRIKLKDVMRGSFRLFIESKFRLRLFEKAVEKEGMIKNLAEKIGCSRDSIRLMKVGKTKFIKWQTVKKLIEIVDISEEKLEPYILAIKAGKSGRINEVRLPIKESKEMAMLIAKGMGDGSIEKNFRFSYWNKDKNLIKEFCNIVNIVAGRSRITVNNLKDGRIQAKCNPFVGLIAHLNGVPTGNKTLQGFNIPKWIRSDSKKMKASFIRGLFDDEAHVQFSKEYGTRRITIVQGKWNEKEKTLENFLNSVRKMLSDLGIDSTEIREQENFIDKKGRKKVMLGFSIYRKENLKGFYNVICFTSIYKKAKLKDILNEFANKEIC